jgi:hypothetical protein
VFQTHDPVVLPRSRSWDINGALIAAAAAATLLVAGATYAVFYTEPSRLDARLGATETPPLQREYTPDSHWGRVNAMKALSGPIVAAPRAVEMSSSPADMSAPSSFDSGSGLMPASGSFTPSTSLAPRTDSGVVIDDSAPGVQDSLPQPAENQPSLAPYPNPTTTPPDAIAPAPESAPALENENPYR